MASVLLNSDPKLLEYELSRLDKAIESVCKIIKKHNDHPHALEYYSVMQECLLALGEALAVSEHIYIEQHKIITRLEILERSVLKIMKEKNS